MVKKSNNLYIKNQNINIENIIQSGGKKTSEKKTSEKKNSEKKSNKKKEESDNEDDDEEYDDEIEEIDIDEDNLEENNSDIESIEEDIDNAVDNDEDNEENNDENEAKDSDNESEGSNKDDKKCFQKYAKNTEDYDINIDEYFVDDVTKIIKTSRLSKPILTKYEKVRLLSIRSKQLAQGAKPMIKNTHNPRTAFF